MATTTGVIPAGSARTIADSLLSALRIAVLALPLLGLAACVRVPLSPEPGQVIVRESDDLGAAVRRARELAAELGSQSVLLAFDIDNTLLAMDTELGSDSWYDWQKELADAEPCDIRVVPDRLAAQGALYHLGAMHPTQDNLGELLAAVREAALPTMVITARGSDFRLSTFRELRRQGLSFRDLAPGPRGGFLENLKLPGAARAVRYEDGVLMLAGQDKGRMLLALYSHLRLEPPAAVVFADDKPANIEAMAAALRAAGIRGELYRYSREDERVAAFQAARAALQWERLRPTLPVVESVMGEANFKVPEMALNPACLEP